MNKSDQNKIALKILSCATDLMRAVEYDDETYKESNISKMVKLCVEFERIRK